MALPLLSGCIAVAALPLMAGGAMFAGGNVKIRAATPRPKTARPKTTGSVRLAPAASEETAGAAIALPPALPPALTQPPGRSVSGGPPIAADLGPPDSAIPESWRDFAQYAADKSAQLAGKPRGRSVLLEPGATFGVPRMRQCENKAPAVLLDLDAGGQAFAPAAARPAAPALVAALTRLRDAGVVVLWITALPAGEVGAVAEALKTSGLDPAGSDPLLLVRDREDRKQLLREDAARDVCVIAIAGDRRGDFDELFDYLRDPASGQSFDYLLGAGWFILPPPLG